MNRKSYLLLLGLTLSLMGGFALPTSSSAKSMTTSVKDWLNVTPSYESGLSAIEHHNYGNALQIFTQLAAKHPHNPRYIYDLALTHQRLGQTSQANTLAQQLKTTFPHSVEAQTITAAQHAVHSVPTTTAISHPSYTATPSKTKNQYQSRQTLAMPAVSVPASSENTRNHRQSDIQDLLKSLSSPPDKTASSTNTPADSSERPISLGINTSTEVSPRLITPQPTDATHTANTQNMQNMMNQMMIMNMMGSLGNNSNNSQQGMGGLGAMNAMGAMGDMTSMMGGGQQNNNNNSMMMMLPLMMQQMNAPNGTQSTDPNNPNSNPYGNIDPDALSTMMMNQVMGSMDFGMGNTDRK